MVVTPVIKILFQQNYSYWKEFLNLGKFLLQRSRVRSSAAQNWSFTATTPTFEPLSSEGCHLYITLWHMWMHVNTRKTKTGCSKNTDASRPAANTLINLLRFYLIKNVMNWKPKSKRRQRSSQDIHTYTTALCCKSIRSFACFYCKMPISVSSVVEF